MKCKYIVACALASLVAIAPLSLIGASANTLSSTPSSEGLEPYGYIDDNAKYNPFGPYRFNYYSPYSDLVYGVDIPDSFEGAPSEWWTYGEYGVFDSLTYSNNTGVFGCSIVDFASNEGVPCINFQLNSDLFWLDSYRDWYLLTDAPYTASMFVWYDTPQGERTYTMHVQDYAEVVNNEGLYSLDIYEMLSGFASDVDEQYGFLDDNGICFVRDFVITLTPVDELHAITLTPLTDDVSSFKSLNQYYVYKYSYTGVDVIEELPDDFFAWLLDVVIKFLETEFLPDVSFGKLILISLGFVVFGLGLKIAFGG